MAQNITLLGASYSDVPAVQLPKTGGGTAQFDDTTDADATAADIVSGKTAYVNGEKIVGTGSGGGPSGVLFITDTLDANGGTVRNIDTTDGTITDTLDANGGTIRSITGAEVYIQEKVATPTESAQNIEPDVGYDALSNVRVGAIPSDYIGSGVPQKTSADLTVSGATVTAPAGVYGSAASKAVASGTATTPATTITANPSISVSSTGLITANTSASQSITPTVSAGYVTSGTAGTVSVSGSNTSQLSTQAAATITPSTSQQTAVASGKYTTGNVIVNPIPSQYIVPSGNIAITSNGDNIDVSAFATASVNVSGGGNWNWYGTNAENIYHSVTHRKLEDTTFSTWTPSTTSFNIETVDSGTISADRANYDYCLAVKFYCNYVYSSGTPLLAAPIKTFGAYFNKLYLAYGTLANIQNNERGSLGTGTASGRTGMLYNTSSGSLDYNNNASYGIYTSGITVTNNSSAVGVSTTVRTRCSTTYFSTGMASALDQANSTYTVVLDIWRIPKATGIMSTFEDVFYDIYQNGLPTS